MTWGNGLDIPEQLTKLEDRWGKIFTGQDKSVSFLVHLCDDEYDTVRWERCGHIVVIFERNMVLFHMRKVSISIDRLCPQTKLIR